MNVAEQVAALSDMDAAELKRLWREYYDGREPPVKNKTFLVKRLAYRIQEMAYGGLSAETAQKLNDLAVEFEQKTPNVLHVGHRPKDPPIAGTRLVREWKGVEHVVSVLPEGYEYQGRRYKSLTAIANHITGSKWNGKVFFNLKKQGAGE